jgi:hypothetical protein
MPFDYANYQEKCNDMTAEELQKEWENYTRQISSGATSTATSILLMPLTAGVSAVGLGISAPRIHNARKKREIIEAGLRARGTTHHTRTGDVLAPMAVSGIIGGLTLGLVPAGASDFAALAAGRAVEVAATNTALTATEAVVVDNARKKMAKEAALQNQFSPEQKTRYGSMPVPFLVEQSVLAFEHPIHHQQSQQPQQPIHGAQTSSTVVQPSISSPGDFSTQSLNPQNVQDQTVPLASSSLSNEEFANSRIQELHNRLLLNGSDAAISASILNLK